MNPLSSSPSPLLTCPGAKLRHTAPDTAAVVVHTQTHTYTTVWVFTNHRQVIQYRVRVSTRRSNEHLKPKISRPGGMSFVYFISFLFSFITTFVIHSTHSKWGYSFMHWTTQCFDSLASGLTLSVTLFAVVRTCFLACRRDSLNP